tara:strand:- start:619 stop:1218 length:600 start_codon:yes stop_codon:yes gene_type:complete
MIKGARDINFFNNTISGDLPSNAFAIRVTQEQQNKKPTNINLYNNIWSDPTGTMGQGTYENSLDFSDTPLYQLNEFTLNSNWYWNNGNKLPYSLLDAINPNDDHEQVNSNPLLGDNEKLTTPVWNGITHTFADGSFEIREAFLRLVSFYGIPKLNHHKRKFSINHKSPAPRSDILNKTRKLPQAIGAYHVNSEKKVQLK